MQQLQNNVFTESGWDIAETTFDPEQLITTGSNTMIGNGYLGYRGTFAEWAADRYVACIVTDTWDTAPDGRWTELCNVPNGLYTVVRVDGAPLSLFDGVTSNYRRALDLRHGIFTRRQTWRGAHGKAITLAVERFASMHDVRLLAMRYTVTAEDDAQITLTTGIDGRVWSLNGEHFRSYDLHQEPDLDLVESVTHEHAIRIAVAAGAVLSGARDAAMTQRQEDRRVLREWTFDLAAGESVTLTKMVQIVHSNDSADPRGQAVAAVRAASSEGYTAAKERHAARWDALWSTMDIAIDGDIEAQTLARFNLYQNAIATPRHARLPIGARGLSCQVYQGAAFWDQEIFNLPVFIYTQPQIARNILEYRYITLDGARRKAQNLGYYGAFYAWTSGKTGDELFPDYFFTDVLTGRPIHNHFNSWQIHISPDIVYAIWQYLEATGDWDFIVRYGAEIAFEVAQFIVARVHFKKDKNRYELIRLLGPDEYHENVDNNAFTMYQSQFAITRAVMIAEQMQRTHPDQLAALMDRLALTWTHVDAWREIADLILLPQPDPHTGVIEQFDGYFDLEDITPEKLRERLIHPDEYWGWPAGIAVETQVLKQADVLQLLALHDIFPRDVLRANFDYYAPRTEHGSSLSPSVHALIAAKADYPQQAYAYFHEGATIDLYDNSKKVMSGGTFLGGIHTAAAGAVWQMVVQGFAGFALRADGVVHFTPRLPGTWDRLAFTLVLRGNVLRVELTPGALTVRAEDANPDALTVTAGKHAQTLQPGHTITFALAG